MQAGAGAGYHVAFSSQREHHCANWGRSYSKRSGVLIPGGTALSPASLLDALRARRLHASMAQDRQPMGIRAENSATLDLSLLHASNNGHRVDNLCSFHDSHCGNGSVIGVSRSALSPPPTPAAGGHFDDGRLFQDDGKPLCLAAMGAGSVVTLRHCTSIVRTGNIFSDNLFVRKKRRIVVKSIK